MAKIYATENSSIQPQAAQNGLKPRIHVINNLLNYSKSLEAQSLKNGKTVLLHLN